MIDATSNVFGTSRQSVSLKKAGGCCKPVRSFGELTQVMHAGTGRYPETRAAVRQNLGGTAAKSRPNNVRTVFVVFPTTLDKFKEALSMYDHKAIEKKWQKHWAEHNEFNTTTDPNKKNYYALDMFPYPSGQGLHVGHPEATPPRTLSRG